MRVRRFPEKHYGAISEAPVELKPFDPSSKRLALEYERALNHLLEPLGVTAQLFGSTARELLGKGEWEFALFLEDATWSPAVAFLRDRFGDAYVMGDAFALFGDDAEGHEVEVIAMRGEIAHWNQAIMRYWRENPDARHLRRGEARARPLQTGLLPLKRRADRRHPRATVGETTGARGCYGPL